jgi:hypothetical protein
MIPGAAIMQSVTAGRAESRQSRNLLGYLGEECSVSVRFVRRCNHIDTVRELTLALRYTRFGHEI